MTIRDLLSHMAADVRQDIRISDASFHNLVLSVKLNDEDEQDNELLDLIADNPLDEWYIDHTGTLVIYLNGNYPQIDLNPYKDPDEYVDFSC